MKIFSDEFIRIIRLLRIGSKLDEAREILSRDPALLALPAVTDISEAAIQRAIRSTR